MENKKFLVKPDRISVVISDQQIWSHEANNHAE